VGADRGPRLAQVGGRHGLAPRERVASLGTKDGVAAYFVWYAALACLQPNLIGAIPDAADDSA
jgi:hypothetical protein